MKIYAMWRMPHRVTIPNVELATDSDFAEDYSVIGNSERSAF